MGRPKSGKRKRDNAAEKGKNKKRARSERFWVENCRETKRSGDVVYDFEILVTRIQLTDDYRTAGTSGTPKEVHNFLAQEALEIKSLQNDVPSKTQTGKPQETSPSTEELKTNEEATKEEPQDTTEPKAPEATEGTFKQIFVKRSKSAKGPIQRILTGVENFVPLRDGDCGDGITNPHPKDVVPDKFWSQRRRLFTKFDNGIQLDRESWFSVTPEAIATHIANHLVGSKEAQIVLDPFCGCGGNAIAFALRPEVKLVVAVDIDVNKLKMAANNAKIYGVPKEKIVFVNDNACSVLACYEGAQLARTSEEGRGSTAKIDIEQSEYRIGSRHLLPETVDSVFLSPPWGGVDYQKVGKRNYSLSCIEIEDGSKKRVSGDDLLKLVRNSVGDGSAALFLPRNTNGFTVGRSALEAGFDGPMVMEQNILNGKLKTVTCYLGLQSV